MKRINWIFAIVVSIALFSLGFSGIVSTGNGLRNSYMSHNLVNAAIYGSNHHKSPPIPRGFGAYESINGSQWIKVNTSVYSGHPNSATPMEGGNYGVEGAGGGNGILTNAVETVSFSQFSGESDQTWGNNAWSVQLNTNTFIGNNGQTDWVQFVFQNNLYNNYIFFKSYYSQFAIWTVDITTNTYNAYSTSIPIQTLSTALQVEIDANSNGGDLNAQLYITTSSGYTVWYLSEPQQYGLSGHWSSVSGTILGAGGGSIADFTSPTHETTVITADGPSTWSPYTYLDYNTAEMNNLNKGTVTTSEDFEPEYYYYGYTVTTESSN